MIERKWGSLGMLREAQSEARTVKDSLDELELV